MANRNRTVRAERGDREGGPASDSNAASSPARARRYATLLLLLGAVSLMSVGCGQLSIRTWVNIITEESWGGITIIPPPGQPPPPEKPITDLEGGFLGFFQVDTRDLPGALNGTAVLEDVRIAGINPGLAERLCTWGDPDGASTGTLSLDLLSGASDVDLFLDAMAQSQVSRFFGFPPVDFEQQLQLELGQGLGIGQFLQILTNGTADGAFATTSTLATETVVAGIPVSVSLDIAVTNGAHPPDLRQSYRNFCERFFILQGTGRYHGVNSKSSYLLADDDDDPLAPIVISLDTIRVNPGDTIRLTRVGTFDSNQVLQDGTQTRMTGVFSATDVLLADSERHRVPDAIDAGNDYFTLGHLECVLIIFCTVDETDIEEDFLIDPEVELVVPVDAEYLIVAPYDPLDLRWIDNSGLGFGVDIEKL